MKTFYRKKGFTIPEIMIYMVLLGIILTGVGGLLMASMKYHRTADRVADLQHSALIALSTVTYDMSDSSSVSISMDGNSSDWMIFASPKSISTGAPSFSGGGELEWHKWVAFYLQTQPDGTKNLIKKEFQINPAKTGSPGASPYSTESDVKNAPAENTKVVARGVESFTVSRDPGSNIFKIQVTIDRTTDTTKPTKITAETEIAVMN